MIKNIRWQTFKLGTFWKLYQLWQDDGEVMTRYLGVFNSNLLLAHMTIWSRWWTHLYEQYG